MKKTKIGTQGHQEVYEVEINHSCGHTVRRRTVKVGRSYLPTLPSLRSAEAVPCSDCLAAGRGVNVPAMDWNEVQDAASVRGIGIRPTLGPMTDIHWPDGSKDENITKGNASRKIRAWLSNNPQDRYTTLRDVRTDKFIAWTDGREVIWGEQKRARRWTPEEALGVLHALYLNGHDYIGEVDTYRNAR